MKRLLAALPPALLLVFAAPSFAELDINDGGPVLSAGRVRMRVTNAGILGNGFFNRGLSNDPSFEFPDGSGNELLEHAELWVGGRDAHGAVRVSGGPMLEWRPTPAAGDTVRVAWHGRLGARQGIDDDGDGRIDEERLDGRDDDGDGEIDEDLGFGAQELLAADYVDDRPEAIYYVYPNNEQHQPLGLSVHQEVVGWGTAGYDGFAGIEFTITNHGDSPVRNVYVGFFADLQSMRRDEPLGQTNDRMRTMRYDASVLDGRYHIRVFDLQAEVDTMIPGTACITRLAATLPVLTDAAPGSQLPVVAVVPMSHTTDPLAFFVPSAASAPARVSFRTTSFLMNAPFSQGGVPILDAQRYDALAGRVAGTTRTAPDDYAELVSCGPFRELLPGRSIHFSVAIVAAATPDSLPSAMAHAAIAHHGRFANLLPDSLGDGHYNFDVGNTGLNGHEACIDPPPGVSFIADPNCAQKFVTPGSVLEPPFSPPVLYQHGTCVWTDADCDVCTGVAGLETQEHWGGPGMMPPSPRLRVIPGDRSVRIEWDNSSEILQAQGVAGPSGARFIGYHVYKLADWRESQSQVAPPSGWSLFQAYYFDTTSGGSALAAVTDTTIDYERVLYEQKLYPAGRYAAVDHEVLDGFDYAYSVSSVVEERTVEHGFTRVQRFESPLIGSFQNVVRPRAAASSAANVWVVPNPYRGNAGWDRPNVVGGVPITHLDFMGLPPSRAKIRIWTIAGDLVAEIEHDGTNGNGQAPWNLVSRNGQDVVSGIYLFTVDSSLGHQTGRFVVIR